MVKKLLVIALVLFCTRLSYMLGAPDNDHFLCGPKDESYAEELDLSKLKHQKVPHEWLRVKISFRWFGYKLEDFTDRYNDGTPFKKREEK